MVMMTAVLERRPGEIVQLEVGLDPGYGEEPAVAHALLYVALAAAELPVVADRQGGFLVLTHLRAFVVWGSCVEGAADPRAGELN